MARKKKTKARPFRELIAQAPRGRSLGFGRDRARADLRGQPLFRAVMAARVASETGGVTGGSGNG